MSIHTIPSEQTLAALREDLYAAEMLISFSKKSDIKEWGNDIGCLGYPAAILLFSFIETMGCILIGKSDSESFYVLREKEFENQDIDKPILKTMYETYRSKLIHNSSLPEHAYLQNDQESKSAFTIAQTGRDKTDAINGVNLYALLCLCKRAFEKLPSNLEETVFLSRPMKKVGEKNLLKSEPPINPSNPSGNISKQF